MAAPLDTSIGHLLRFLREQAGKTFSTDDLLQALREQGPIAWDYPFWPLRRPGYLEHVLQDLTELGLVQPTEAEGRWRAAAAGGWPPAGDGGGDGGGGDRGGNAPDGGDGPGRGLREVLSHPYLLSYSSEDFDAALSNALTRIER